jgi:hypothetical protein
MNEFKILSEKSEHHWPFLNTVGAVLLDIGCGRHDTPDLPDTSPAYLGREAGKVISVDASQKEIDFFNSSNLDKNKFIFICKRIGSKEDILDLIREYNPTVIKCDIEEHETNFYEITQEEMSNVREIAIEYHTFEILENIKNKMIEWGFTIHSEGKFGFVNAPQMGVLFARR